MKLHSLTTVIGLAIGFAVALPAIAETDTTVTVTKSSNHHYVYYGDHQIYFAPETKTYYWQTTSTGPWQSGTTLPLESTVLTLVKPTSSKQSLSSGIFAFIGLTPRRNAT